MKHKSLFFLVLVLFVFVVPTFAQTMPSLENILEFPLGTPAEDILASFEAFGCDKTMQTPHDGGIINLFCEDNRTMDGNRNLMSFYVANDGTGTFRLVQFEGIRTYRYDPESMHDDFNKYLENSKLSVYMNSDIFSFVSGFDGFTSVSDGKALYLAEYIDGTDINYPLMFVHVMAITEQ